MNHMTPARALEPANKQGSLTAAEIKEARQEAKRLPWRWTVKPEEADGDRIAYLMANGSGPWDVFFSFWREGDEITVYVGSGSNDFDAGGEVGGFASIREAFDGVRAWYSDELARFGLTHPAFAASAPGRRTTNSRAAHA